MRDNRPLAAVTGASSGIGLELARQFAAHGSDLVLVAEDDGIDHVAGELRAEGVRVEAVRADLATAEGVRHVCERIDGTGRPLHALALNAGVAQGGAFLERPMEAHRRVVQVDVTANLRLLHHLLPGMVERGRGRVLVVSSVNAMVPGSYLSVYNASKAFLQSFTQALQDELGRSGVTLTLAMPGATDTPVFDRAGMARTVAGSVPKDDPAKVARQAFEAMAAGRRKAVVGSRVTKVLAAGMRLLPDRTAAVGQRLAAVPWGERRPRR